MENYLKICVHLWISGMLFRLSAGYDVAKKKGYAPRSLKGASLYSKFLAQM